MKKGRRLVATCALAFLVAASVPATAFAANISNSMTSTSYSPTLNQTVNFTCGTTYEPIGVGGYGIPFWSDWLVEIPCSFFSTPTTLSYSGTTSGTFSCSNGILVAYIVWQQKTAPSAFAQTQTWYGVYSTKTTTKTSTALTCAHGQTHDSATSEGNPAYVKITIS